MHTTTLSRLVAIIGLAALGACSSDAHTGLLPTDAVPGITRQTGGATRLNAPVPGTCSTPAELERLALASYGPLYPVSDVINKVRAMVLLVANNDIAGAKVLAIDIIDTLLLENRRRPVGGSDLQISTFINTVSCYSGLNFVQVTDPKNSDLILPSDQPQVLVSDNGLAAVAFDGNPVSEPTLVTVKVIPFTITRPGEGPLNTKLDQYRGFYTFEKSSENNVPLAKPVVIGLCAPSSLDATLSARLRVGHGATAGFEITDAADASFLDCTNAYAAGEVRGGLSGLLGQVASLFTPRVAFAATGYFVGRGVGGLAREFSPFGLVDPLVSFNRGVGGLAREFKILANGMNAPACTNDALIGNGLEPGCRPVVMLETDLGTKLEGAPITFAVELGGGRVADQTPSLSCGAFAGTIITPTLASGRATACWTMGTLPGLNRVRVTAGIGGDVPAGVIFANFIEYAANAKAPTAMRFAMQPNAGQNIVAGAPISVSVDVVDVNGVVARGFTGPVTLTLTRNGILSSAPQRVSAVNGVATFRASTIRVAGVGYRANVTSNLFGNAVNTAGNLFNIIP